MNEPKNDDPMNERICEWTKKMGKLRNDWTNK